MEEKKPMKKRREPRKYITKNTTANEIDELLTEKQREDLRYKYRYNSSVPRVVDPPNKVVREPEWNGIPFFIGIFIAGLMLLIINLIKG